MTKRDLIKKKVMLEVWPMFRKIYRIRHIAPKTQSQKEFMDQFSQWVYQEFGQYFTAKEIEGGEDS